MKQLDLFGQHKAASKPAPPLPDAHQRALIRSALDQTLFVEAAAGTGKTTELIARMIAVLRSGIAPLQSMVALTFTDKAAGELKLRLREEIEGARRDAAGQERERLDQALRQLETAQIGTIHSFCAELLRERPVEAGVDPLFETLSEDQAALLLDEVFDVWFQQVLAAPPPGVRRILRRREWGRDGRGPREMLRRAVAKLVQHRDFPAPWQRPQVAREETIDAVLARMGELCQLSSRLLRPKDYLARSVLALQQAYGEQLLLEQTRGRDYDGLEAWLRRLPRERLWAWKGSPRQSEVAPGVSREQVLEQRAALLAQIEELIADSDAELAALLHRELSPVVAAYEQRKARTGVLDFLDLLVRARDMLRDDAGVRATLQRRFSHFFVDEFQDTDPLQVEILLLLAADDCRRNDWQQLSIVPGKLFLVGDPKQSIYRFRRADVALYEALKHRLCQQGARVVALEASFRAVPELQQAVNAAFAPVMSCDEAGGQADYVPLRPVRPGEGERPCVVALPVPRPYASFGWKSRITLRQIDQSYPEAVGAFIHWLVNHSGWTVPERRSPRGRVALQPRHICLLFRRFSSFDQDLTQPYVRALERRNVPHVVVGGRSFHSREEIAALRSALVAIEWPEDELEVYAVLRGPLFGLTDDQLLAFRQRTGHFHPLRRVEVSQLAGPEREVASALELLGQLHPGRNRRPASATLMRLLEGVRAQANLALSRGGAQALANVLQLVDLLRRLEASGVTSFRALVERLEQDAGQGVAQEAPVVEEGTEGVRMMTVHKAKGLEFPVVILVDPTAPLEPSTPSRHVDPAAGLWAEPLAGCQPLELQQNAELELERDAQEVIRLVYVAATRARELLVVPALGDSADVRPCWLDVLNPAIYPALEQQRDPQPAPGCPAFGGESVLDRPADAEALPDSSVAPGLHRPRQGEHRVVWWDPASLDLDVPTARGALRRALARALEGEGGSDAARRDYDRWRTRRKQALSQGGQASVRVEAVTRVAARQVETTAAPAVAPRKEQVQVELHDVGRERSSGPGGRRFGTLVHAVLAVVPLCADAAQVEAAVAAQGRALGAAEEELAAALVVVQRALASALMRRAAEAVELRREVPILGQLDDGSLVEGAADMVFREPDGRWWVVDFKTDQAMEGRLPEYQAQVRLYVDAVARATGEPTVGALLWL